MLAIENDACMKRFSSREALFIVSSRYLSDKKTLGYYAF